MHKEYLLVYCYRSCGKREQKQRERLEIGSTRTILDASILSLSHSLIFFCTSKWWSIGVNRARRRETRSIAHHDSRFTIRLLSLSLSLLLESCVELDECSTAGPPLTVKARVPLFSEGDVAEAGANSTLPLGKEDVGPFQGDRAALRHAPLSQSHFAPTQLNTTTLSHTRNSTWQLLSK